MTSLEEALSLVIADAEDAAFVARCILGEGPAHHRASSWALVTLASHAARSLGIAPCDAASAEGIPVPLRLPPHAERADDNAFPLTLPLAPLRGILERERDVEAIGDALVDGPPHHALANAALVALLGRILERASELEAAKK